MERAVIDRGKGKSLFAFGIGHPFRAGDGAFSNPALWQICPRHLQNGGLVAPPC